LINFWPFPRAADVFDLFDQDGGKLSRKTTRAAILISTQLNLKFNYSIFYPALWPFDCFGAFL